MDTFASKCLFLIHGTFSYCAIDNFQPPFSWTCLDPNFVICKLIFIRCPNFAIEYLLKRAKVSLTENSRLVLLNSAISEQKSLFQKVLIKRCLNFIFLPNDCFLYSNTAVKEKLASRISNGALNKGLPKLDRGAATKSVYKICGFSLRHEVSFST